jgi:hypothetical protein
MGQTVNLLPFGFDGSNPSSPTKWTNPHDSEKGIMRVCLVSFTRADICGSMSIVGVTQNGNTGWSGVKLLHFPLNDGTCEEYDCGSDENYDNRRHCV